MKEKPKHTPGPWTVKYNGSYGPFVIAPATDKTGYGAAAHHLGVESHGVAAPGGPNASANAALIAAAPDLLAACEAALNALNDPEMDCYHDAEALETKLESAIERATGKGAS